MNLLLILFCLILVGNSLMGYKNVRVRELVAFISLMISCIMVALIGSGLKSYHSGEVFNLIVVVILLALLGVVNMILRPIFFSAKLIAKLPVIHFADRLMGVLVGALEAILFLWLLYFFVMNMELGSIGNLIIEYTKGSGILTWFFQHNYLALFLVKLSQMQILPKLM